jgi:hypothetical protein
MKRAGFKVLVIGKTVTPGTGAKEIVLKDLSPPMDMACAQKANMTMNSSLLESIKRFRRSSLLMKY